MVVIEASGHRQGSGVSPRFWSIVKPLNLRVARLAAGRDVYRSATGAAALRHPLLARRRRDTVEGAQGGSRGGHNAATLVEVICGRIKTRLSIPNLDDDLIRFVLLFQTTGLSYQPGDIEHR